MLSIIKAYAILISGCQLTVYILVFFLSKNNTTLSHQFYLLFNFQTCKYMHTSVSSYISCPLSYPYSFLNSFDQVTMSRQLWVGKLKSDHRRKYPFKNTTPYEFKTTIYICKARRNHTKQCHQNISCELSPTHTCPFPLSSTHILHFNSPDESKCYISVLLLQD